MPRRPLREIRRRRRALASGAEIRRYLEAHRVGKLQLDAGHNKMSGWLNTDRDPDSGAVYPDAARRLPFAEGTFGYVFSEHLIEHLPYESGVAMPEECHRVLAPGGRIRVATPDLHRIAGLVDAPEGGIKEEYVRWITESFVPEAEAPLPAYAINQLFRGWGHRFLYDRETLEAVLGHAGFSEVKEHAPGHSGDPQLSGLEDHGDDRRMGEFETLVLEALRP